MKVSIQGNGSVFPSGVSSSQSWQGAEMKFFLRSIFGAKANEQITHIEVSRDGIRAHFEKKT